MSTATTSQQSRIIEALGVESDFDADQAIERRIDFLCRELVDNNLHALVLGISGGLDSSTAGRLCQRAVERLREQDYNATFYALRLPYGEQADESDAQHALKFIQPDRELGINIKPTSDAHLDALKEGGLTFSDEYQQDFVLGNIKARERMIAQYAVAGTHGGLVVGTDHPAEAVMGFFTKFGDGACDITPLGGLNKRRIRAMADALGADESISGKTPTADLESLTPQRSDEDAFGIRYDDIDDYLEGKPVSDHVERTIVEAYRKTSHKRELPRDPA
ncbi:ammonia-dependent NAD(+) synthetase [Kushneria phosphatilytica]|uniref:NH(3)-dependent NAD(+) synthetase n=1 Tax=Kushneria phosphatilytica TaxID=657387 RepID=A0A1S1NRW2_9GAMM|nr:ammonia-dependent NAD(+) synthetase [Kushneria phosphatilytica]OHV07660.1 NAD(+) synthase [Kushneria phosphatilytica]QEL10152.1 ammonia-dependent NAD(+) synthetase [Kushneria phosphatilytica]